VWQLAHLDFGARADVGICSVHGLAIIIPRGPAVIGIILHGSCIQCRYAVVMPVLAVVPGMLPWCASTMSQPGVRLGELGPLFN
jgi:hypothetical protein